MLKQAADGDYRIQSLYGGREVALDPDYSDNRWLYLTYAHGSLEANNTRLARARLVDDELHDFEVLFTAQPLKAGAAHYGGRIAFLADKTLVLTLGDGFDWREQAQNPANHLGKIVRLNRDGSVPADNPLLGQAGAAAEIYSLGHRNVQGAAINPVTKELWTGEHGPQGGDEINIIRSGRNYGWPTITHGVNYVTGDYSRGAAGYWVENGVIQYPVHEITIAGHLGEMFKQIVAIGADAYTYGSKTVGSVLIERMKVAGH